VRADLDTSGAVPTLVLRGLSVFPWRPEEEGPRLVPFDLAGLGLAPCPGAVPEARGECLLAAGRHQEALAQFAEAAGRPGGSPLASLRLGDLALASDEPALAAQHWRRAANEFPFGRLVTARLCELEPRCLRSAERPAFFDASLAAEPVRRDLIIRGARLRLLEGDRIGVLETLVAQMSPRGACADVMPWCRRVLLDALRVKGPEGAAALRLYLELPGRDQGPLAGELGRAAADQAEAAGATVFAANLLAALTGRIPDAQQPAHLKRVALLFFAGGDRARAEEIVLFAQARLDRATWRRDGWEALQRSVRAGPPSERSPQPATSPARDAGADPDVAMAHAAVEAARAVVPATGDQP
jgi:tetratricopeptide (TPR) repeat protein